MIICCMAATASAASEVKFTIEDATAARGETIEFPVQISGNTGERGIAAGKIEMTVPTTSDGTAVFTIDEAYSGNWARENVAASSPSDGIFNWASSNGNRNESGVYAIYVITIGKDVEPGDYVVTIKSSDIHELTGEKDEKGIATFNDLEGGESTAILTVTDKVVVPVEVPGAEVKHENEGAQISIGDGDKDQTNSNEPSENDNQENKSDNTTDTPNKAGATISSDGKTIVSTASSTDTSNKTDSSGTKDSTAKTGINEGMHFYLMICLLAAACMIPVGYQIKKRVF